MGLRERLSDFLVEERLFHFVGSTDDGEVRLEGGSSLELGDPFLNQIGIGERALAHLVHDDRCGSAGRGHVGGDSAASRGLGIDAASFVFVGL